MEEKVQYKKKNSRCVGSLVMYLARPCNLGKKDFLKSLANTQRKIYGTSMSQGCFGRLYQRVSLPRKGDNAMEEGKARKG